MNALGRSRPRFAGIAVLMLAACAACSARRAPHQVTPQLVDPTSLDATIRHDIRYAGSHNFLGRPARGYDDAVCLLARPAADALVCAQARLRPHGLSLLVLDCYRPQRAVDDFLAWASDAADTATKPQYYPNVDKRRIVPEGYIAEKSGHSRASTVDLTIVRLSSGGGATELDMGTTYDFFDPSAATDSPAVPPQARENRRLLRDVMTACGMSNYEQEWWHYTLENEPYPDSYFDVPVRRRDAR